MNEGRTELDAYWTKWLRHSMTMGVDLLELLERLRKEGFTDQAIAAGFDAVRPQNDATEVSFTPPLLKRNPPNLRRFDDPRVELYTLEEFLSRRECERLVGLIDHHLKPSTVSFDNGDKGFRTSQTSHLSHLRSPVAVGIDDKICKTLGIRPEYSEGIQAQRYDVGQQFKPHWDWFEPGTREYLRYCGTVATYRLHGGLNEGMEAAVRATVGLSARLGMALFRRPQPRRLDQQGDHASGEPVIAGHKIITKWFRAIGDGPVFFSERRVNQQAGRRTRPRPAATRHAWAVTCPGGRGPARGSGIPTALSWWPSRRAPARQFARRRRSQPAAALRKPPNLRRVNDKAELYTLEDFLSAGDCEQVVALIAHHLKPSALSYVPDDKSFRTSSTAELCHLRSPVALNLDDRICRTLGIRADYSEGIQAQRYDVGQQFKPLGLLPMGSNLYELRGRAWQSHLDFRST
jgi:prolyl 4-hydroxylase